MINIIISSVGGYILIGLAINAAWEREWEGRKQELKVIFLWPVILIAPIIRAVKYLTPKRIMGKKEK